MFILLALLPLLMRIKNSLFVVMPFGCSNWENIDIEKKGKYRGNIVSNEKAGIAHPYRVLGIRYQRYHKQRYRYRFFALFFKRLV